MATTYKQEMDAGVAGAIATTENKDIVSATVEDVAGIEFGRAVTFGVGVTDSEGYTYTQTIRSVKTGDTNFVGVTVLDRTAGDLINGKFIQYESARVMVKGVIWVQVTEAVKAGDSAAVDLATGKFNKSGQAYPNARYETSAPVGGLAKLRLK